MTPTELYLASLTGLSLRRKLARVQTALDRTLAGTSTLDPIALHAEETTLAERWDKAQRDKLNWLSQQAARAVLHYGLQRRGYTPGAANRAYAGSRER